MQTFINTIKGIERALINSEFGRIGICLSLLGSGMFLTLLLQLTQKAPAIVSPVLTFVIVGVILVALFAMDRIMAVREGNQPEVEASSRTGALKKPNIPATPKSAEEPQRQPESAVESRKAAAKALCKRAAEAAQVAPLTSLADLPGVDLTEGADLQADAELLALQEADLEEDRPSK